MEGKKLKNVKIICVKIGCVVEKGKKNWGMKFKGKNWDDKKV